ncbi:MAG TPA: WYL domain-containing protein [Glaciihabitans sp.]|nr:WYL domain-containing protein [Glaciihabitans sp.]
MAEHKAQDKLAFLLSLVPYLVDHDRVSVTEIARHFDVPAAQIRDAVRLIGVSGVPGETAQYQHGDLFDIAWDDFEMNDQIVLTNRVAIDDSPRFSAREAAALIAGLQYLSALPEHADRAAIATLMAKLSRGASASPSQVAIEASETDQTLALIREAVTSGVQIQFDYLTSRGDDERRTVEPLRIQSLDADWYLRAWCHLREGVRTFRLDRISNPVLTEEPVTFRSKDVTLGDSLFEGSADDLLVTIEVTATAAPLLADYIPDGAVTVERENGRVCTSIRVSHFHGLKRLLATMSGVATVIEPEEARRVVADWAAQGAARYTSNAGRPDHSQSE